MTTIESSTPNRIAVTHVAETRMAAPEFTMPILVGVAVGAMSAHFAQTAGVSVPTFGGIETATRTPQEVQAPSALSVQIESGDGYFAVSDAPTGIFGVGESLTDAFGDFAVALTEH